MRKPASTFFALTPEAVWQWGRILLGGGLAFSIALVLLLAWKAPSLLPFIPALVLGGVVIHFLIQRPLLHLCVVIGGFVALLPQIEGFQWYEVLYGLYALGYLAGWFLYHALLRRDKILRTVLDKAIFLFLIYATATFALTFVFDGSPAKALAEWIALTFLFFYFPIKEMVRERPRAIGVLLLSFGLLALFVVLRNFYTYYFDMLSAERVYQILQNRERTNERFLMIAMFGALTLYLYLDKKVGKVALICYLTLLLGGIFVSMSRMIWLSSAFGTLLLFLLMRRKKRMQMMLMAGSGTVVLAVLGMLLLDDFFLLIVSGLRDRFTSIGSAATQDLSMVNRFFEWRTAWRSIITTPIIGHGFGVPYEYYSLQYRFTEVKYFIHNMYLGIWYRHGVIGLGMILFILARVQWDGYKIIQSRIRLTGIESATIIACMASVVGFAFAGLTEPLFLVDDGVFSLAYPMALLSGLWQSHIMDATRG